MNIASLSSGQQATNDKTMPGEVSSRRIFIKQTSALKIRHTVVGSYAAMETGWLCSVPDRRLVAVASCS